MNIITKNNTGNLIVSLLMVAQHFDRAHDNVLKSIDSLIESGHLTNVDFNVCSPINEIQHYE